jgi:hypothetical protein
MFIGMDLYEKTKTIYRWLRLDAHIDNGVHQPEIVNNGTSIVEKPLDRGGVRCGNRICSFRIRTNFGKAKVGQIWDFMVRDQSYLPVKLIGLWENEQDRVFWAAKEKTVAESVRLLRECSDDPFAEALTPIRKAYHSLPSLQRSILLSKVMHFILKD